MLNKAFKDSNTGIVYKIFTNKKGLERHLILLEDINDSTNTFKIEKYLDIDFAAGKVKYYLKSNGCLSCIKDTNGNLYIGKEIDI